MSNPNIPIVNAGIKYVNNCIIQWASNTTLSIFTGAARDNRDENDILLGSLIAPISNVAVVLNTALVGVPGGLDTGTLAANTNYAIFAIGDSTGNNAASVVFAVNNLQPILPAGYDIYRRIGFMRTDGSSNLYRWFQYGRAEDRWYYYDAPISILAGGAATTFTSVSVTSGMPAISAVTAASINPSSEALLAVTYTPNSAANTLQFGSSASASNAIITFGAGVAAVQKTMLWVPTFGNNIFYKVAASDTVSISVAGFKDYLSAPQ